jgi:ferredoxin-NADP reductase
MSPEATPVKHTSRLLRRHEVAERTWAFQFERPTGFEFRAGQFMEVTLRSPMETDAEGDTRPFTIASPPHEPFLMITTRMRDTAFKRNLAAMPLGTELTIVGPFGDLVLHSDEARPAVFLAGGIGITPFRSIALDATHRKLRHELTLFYSNRRPEDAPYVQELEALGRTHPNFHLVATMTAMEKSHRPWKGERGRIDPSMMARHAPTSGTPVHYVAGPPGLVRELQTMLRAERVAEENIRAEEFDGY